MKLIIVLRAKFGRYEINGVHSLLKKRKLSFCFSVWLSWVI